MTKRAHKQDCGENDKKSWVAMKKGQQIFAYGTHRYEYLLVESRRRSLGLYVFPDMRIEVRVPVGTPEVTVEEFLRKKWLWLEKRLTEFRRYKKPTYHPRFLSGESLRYLGRQLILDIQPSDTNAVSIERTKLLVRSTHSLDDGAWNQTLIEDWLDKRRQTVFAQQYERACNRFQLTNPPQLKIRTMKTRWGSYSTKTHTVYLNARLVEAPTEAILLVCIHELCHLKHLNHGKAFYAAMDKYQDADWRKTKEKLELTCG